MPLDLWLAFVAASTALLLIPGPTVFAVRNTLAYAPLADKLLGMIGKPAVITWLTRIGGTTLVRMGILTATLRSAT